VYGKSVRNIAWFLKKKKPAEAGFLLVRRERRLLRRQLLQLLGRDDLAVERGHGRKAGFIGSMNETRHGWQHHYEIPWEDDARL
jgi:hypothetical protein